MVLWHKQAQDLFLAESARAQRGDYRTVNTPGDADNCTAAFSALNAAGQQQALTYCAGEGACSKGVSACVEAALFPAAEGVGGGGPRR